MEMKLFNGRRLKALGTATPRCAVCTLSAGYPVQCAHGNGGGRCAQHVHPWCALQQKLHRITNDPKRQGGLNFSVLCPAHGQYVPIWGPGRGR